MRPIATQQNATQYPLDEVLGAPANVRLVRVLADAIAEPISTSDAAKLAGLTLAGARRALDRLVKTGFVQRVGGHSPLYELVENDSLIMELRDLFRCERNRYQAFLSQLRRALAELPEIRVAWIDSPPSEAGKPFHIGVLSDSRSLTYLRGQLRKRVSEIEKQYDIVLEIHSFAGSDAPEIDWDKTELLAGYPKAAKISAGRTHADREIRAMRFSSAIARLLHEEPSLIRRAIKHVELLLQQNQGSAAHDLREWHEILTNYSRQRLRDFVVSDTPRAQRLRQSSPFFAVLSSAERDNLLRAAETKE